MAKAPKAEVEVTADSKTLGQRLREARVKFAGFAGELRNNIFGKDLLKNGFLSKAGASLVGNLGASALSSAANFGVQQAKDVFDFNDALKRLEITASSTPEEMMAFGESVRRSSSAVGIGAKEILSGAQAYVALTGDMKGATLAADQWARVAQATGSTVGDIASTAAALKQQMDIKPEQMEQTFAALAAQGKAGAIELKDLASQLQTIAPQWAEFAGGKGVQGVKELGAALQIAKRGFGGDASETITGVQSLLNAYVKNAARLQKGGVKIFEKDPATGVKHLRNVLDITQDLANSKLAKDPTKLEKALGRVEAYRVLLQWKDTRAEMQKLVETAGDATLIQRDLDNYLQSSAGKSKTAWEAAKNEMAEAFTPDRIDSLTAAMVAGIRVASTFAAVVAGIVSKTEQVGVMFAKLLGYETEDDKALRLQGENKDARAARHLDAVRDANPYDEKFGFGDTPIDYVLRTRKMAGDRVDAEDAHLGSVVARVKAGRGARFGAPTIGGDFPMQPGPLQGPVVGAPGDPLSKDELGVMIVQAIGSNSTNSGAEVKFLADAIAKLAASQDAFLKRFGDKASAPLQFSIGPDPVMNATRNAPQNARRPGG